MSIFVAYRIGVLRCLVQQARIGIGDTLDMTQFC